MIVKITRGTDLPRLVRYLFGPGRANEHRDQHAVALARSLRATPVGEELDTAQVAALGQRMDAMRVKFKVPAQGALRRAKVNQVTGDGPGQLSGIVEEHGRGPGHVWHMSLSIPVGDRQLSDAEWGAITQGAMDRMGFTEAGGKAPVRWVAVRHGVSVNGHDHVHIAATIVRDDGTKATVFRDYQKVSAYAAEVERQYGLVVVGGRATRGVPGLTRAEIERARRDGRPEAVRTTLARLVRAARTASANEGEFVRRLRLSGVVVRPRWGAGVPAEGTEAVVGYSVGLGQKGETVWFGGGRLGSDLSLPQLRQFWEATPAETAAAAEVWRSPGHWGREINRVPSEEWRRFSRILDKSYDALLHLPADSSQWPVVARELSGLYAAWSRRLEGRRPGPLARAADLLAQAGQVAPTDTPPPRSAVRGYRGAAMVVSQAHLGPDDRGTGWAMLLVALTRHLHLVAQIEGARGQQRLSAQLAAAATKLDRTDRLSGRQTGRGGPFPDHVRPLALRLSRAPTGREKGVDSGR